MNPAIQSKIAACYAALGKRLDTMRVRWDSMGAGDRRVLLLSARLHGGFEGRAWDEIKPKQQQRIAAAFQRMTAWAQQVATA